MMRSATLVLSLLALGESLKLDPKTKAWAKREFTEESAASNAEHARARAALKEDKTGGNEICKARMEIHGKKMDFKAISKARQENPGDNSHTNCYGTPSDSKLDAKDLQLPAPSTDDVEFGGIIYITLGGEREGYIKKALRKLANDTAVYKHNAGGPPASKSKLKEYSTGKDASSMSQYNKATISATRAVYLSHMEAIMSVQELAKSKVEGEATPNKAWLILEDDTKLDKDWNAKITDIIKNTPSDWDMIKVGYWAERRCSDKVNSVVFAPSVPTKSQGQILYMGNQGYLVRPESVPNILAAMQKQKVADIDESFVFASCRARKEGSIRPCMNLYASSVSNMAAKHKQMGSDRWSGDAAPKGQGWGWFGLHKNLEPNIDEPWKDGVTSDNYPFEE